MAIPRSRYLGGTFNAALASLKMRLLIVCCHLENLVVSRKQKRMPLFRCTLGFKPNRTSSAGPKSHVGLESPPRAFDSKPVHGASLKASKATGAQSGGQIDRS